MGDFWRGLSLDIVLETVEWLDDFTVILKMAGRRFSWLRKNWLKSSKWLVSQSIENWRGVDRVESQLARDTKRVNLSNYRPSWQRGGAWQENVERESQWVEAWRVAKTRFEWDEASFLDMG